MLKTSPLLNGRLTAVLTTLRHGETIVIADAGLPAPDGVERLDLAIAQGVPSLADVLPPLRDGTVLEEVLVASDMQRVNPDRRAVVADVFGDEVVREIPHLELEALLPRSKLIVQTGECTPYANVVLVGGVSFFDMGMVET
jgi:D-ribose pyranase